MPGKNFEQELKEYAGSFKSLWESFSGNYQQIGRGKSSLLDSLFENLGKVFGFVNTLDTSLFQLPSHEQFDDFTPAVSGCLEDLNKVWLMPEQLNMLSPELRQSIAENNGELLRLFSNNKTLDTISGMVTERDSFVKSYNDESIEDEITDLYIKTGSSGHPMSINDCRNFSVENPDMDKTMDQLLWLANQSYMMGRIFPEKENRYTAVLDKLSEDIDQVSPDIQAKFASKIVKLETGLRDACQEKYQTFYNSCPEGSDPQAYAYEKLYESPEYTGLSAFVDFKSKYFFGKKFNEYLNRIATANENKPGMRNLKNRPSTKMGDLVNGDMKKFFEKRGINIAGEELDVHEIESFEPALEKNGFIISESLNNIIKENDNLLNDKGKSSDSMKAMRDKVNAFMDLNHGDPASIPDYDKKLQDAIDAVEEYKSSHSSRRRFTGSGKERLRIANSLSENLAAFKREQEERKKTKAIVSERFKESSKVLDAALGMDAGNSFEKGISSKQFAEEILKLENKPTADYQKEFNKEAKRLGIPEKDLKLSAEEKKERELIHKTGLKNFAQAKFESANPAGFLRTAVKYGSMKESDIIDDFRDRDLPLFLFDQGDDGKTIKSNIERANKYLGKNLSKNDPKYSEKLNAQRAEIVKERIDKFKAVDYDGILKLSDKELAENYVQINRDCMPVSIMQKAMELASKDNPKITDQMKKDAATLVNKYSGLVPHLAARMNIIGSEYYGLVNTNPLTDMPINHGFSVIGFSTDNMGVERLNMSVGNHCNTGSVIYLNMLKNSIVKDPSDTNEYDNISFFDKDGNKLLETEVLDANKNGTVYAISDGIPDTLRAFSYGGKGFEYKAESIDKNPEVRDMIKSVANKDVKKLYSDFAKKNQGAYIKLSNMTSELSSSVKGISLLNYRNKLKELGITKDDSIALNENLLQIHNAVYAGKSLDEVKQLPAAKEYQNVIGELYSAAKDDFYNKKLASSTVDRVFNMASYQKVDEDVIKAEAKANGIKTLSASEASAAQGLKNKSLEIMKNSAKDYASSYSVSHRAFGIAMRKEGLSDEDKYEIASGSFTNEGQRKVIQGITDDVLSEDFSEIGKLNTDKYMDNYSHLNYMRLATFDPSYTSFRGFDELFSPAERKDYETICEGFAGPLNYCDGMLSNNTCNAAGIIDMKKLTVEQAAMGMASQSAENKEFWAYLTTNAFLNPDSAELKGALASYDRLQQSRWTNTLLGKPGITEDEIAFINDCLKATDPAAGRMRLYEYAIAEFTKASDGLGDAKNDPETASYMKACSSAGKMLLTQMKRDGYDILPEQRDRLTKACGEMGKINANIAPTLNRGRALNQWSINNEKSFEKENAKKIAGKEAVQSEGIRNTIQKNRSLGEQALREAIAEGDLAKMTEAGSKFMYFNKLAMKSDKMNLGGLVDATNPDKINDLTEQVKPVMKEYLKAITVPTLKELAEGKGFAKEFTKGFNFFTKNRSLEGPSDVKEGPEKEV